jgi:hypothetical protein
VLHRHFGGFAFFGDWRAGLRAVRHDRLSRREERVDLMLDVDLDYKQV